MTSTTTTIALPWVSLLAITGLIALCLNIVVIIVILHDRYRRGGNYTLALVCNMAASDVLYVSLAIPLILASAFNKENWNMGNAGCKFMMFLPNFCISSSIYTLVFVAFDRRKAILSNRPRVHSRRSILLAPICVWLISLVVAAPAFYEYSVYKRPVYYLEEGHGSSSEEIDDYPESNITKYYLACGSHGIVASFEKIYASIVFAVAYIVPLLIITINYIMIARYLIKRNSAVAAQEMATCNTTTPSSTTKAANTVGRSKPISDISDVGGAEGVVQSHPPFKSCSKATTISNMEHSSQKTGASGNPSTSKTFVQKSSTRIIKMLLILVVTFAIFWAPYFVIFVREEVTGTDDSAKFGEVLHVVKLFASVSTCVLNPIIYTVFDSRIRKGARKLFCRKDDIFTTKSPGNGPRP